MPCILYAVQILILTSSLIISGQWYTGTQLLPLCNGTQKMYKGSDLIKETLGSLKIITAKQKSNYTNPS